MTDLEAVALLIGGKPRTDFMNGGVQMPSGMYMSGWQLAGACLEKLFELDEWPSLRATRLPDGSKDWEADVQENLKIPCTYSASPIAAIIACAAAVSRQERI